MSRRPPRSMHGKTCLVTGATNGHGLAVAQRLARLGADLVLLARNPEKAHRVAEALRLEAPGRRRPTVILADLSRQTDVADAAAAFLQERPERPLHLLVNNAGMVSLRREETAEGRERVLAVNYLALAHLTRRLLPRLQATGTPTAPARVVNVSSDMHRMVRLDLGNLELHRGYSWWRSYAQSKLAIVYFTRELARRLGPPAPAGTATVIVNAVDPGPVRSGIASAAPALIARATDELMRLFPPPARAARTALWLATAPEAGRLTGQYARFGRLHHPRVPDEPRIAEQLWAWTSEQIAGLE